MIYVIGDIHGKKDKYDEMLAKLSPKETDAVFVLGDIIDIGDDSIEILQDMIVSAVNEVLRKADEAQANNLKGLTGGLNIPGLF